MRHTSLLQVELAWAILGLILVGCAGMRPEPRFDGGPAAHHVETMTEIRETPTDWERDLVLQLRQYLGAPYVWGGVSPQGVDCSGLVVATYGATLGIELPHSVRELYNLGQQVERKHLKVGDLLFFGDVTSRLPDHVGIYVGAGKFVHASRTTGVTVSDLNDPYYRRRWKGAKRIVTSNALYRTPSGGNTQ